MSGRIPDGNQADLSDQKLSDDRLPAANVPVVGVVTGYIVWPDWGSNQRASQRSLVQDMASGSARRGPNW